MAVPVFCKTCGREVDGPCPVMMCDRKQCISCGELIPQPEVRGRGRPPKICPDCKKAGVTASKLRKKGDVDKFTCTTCGKLFPREKKDKGFRVTCNECKRINTNERWRRNYHIRRSNSLAASAKEAT